MQYFTPERYLRLQAFDRPDLVEQAMAEWDEALREYARTVEQSRARLADGTRAFLDGFCLHDAEIVATGRGGDPLAYRLVVREEGAAYLTEVVYQDAEPSLAGSAFPAGDRGDASLWLYDEIAVNPHVLTGWPPLMVHSILLGDGRVLTIRFRDLTVTRLEPLPVAVGT